MYEILKNLSQQLSLWQERFHSWGLNAENLPWLLLICSVLIVWTAREFFCWFLRIRKLQDELAYTQKLVFELKTELRQLRAAEPQEKSPPPPSPTKNLNFTFKKESEERGLNFQMLKE